MREKVEITARALLQRVNRAKKAEKIIIKKSRASQVASLGQYFAVDLNLHFVCQKDVNLLVLAREIGVLEPWETLERE